MTVAYKAALEFAPVEVRWWSYKWVFGHLATSYGARTIRKLARE